jgi:hypothetical protein
MRKISGETMFGAVSLMFTEDEQLTLEEQCSESE